MVTNHSAAFHRDVANVSAKTDISRDRNIILMFQVALFVFHLLLLPGTAISDLAASRFIKIGAVTILGSVLLLMFQRPLRMAFELFSATALFQTVSDAEGVLQPVHFSTFLFIGSVILFIRTPRKQISVEVGLFFLIGAGFITTALRSPNEIMQLLNWGGYFFSGGFLVCCCSQLRGNLSDFRNLAQTFGVSISAVSTLSLCSAVINKWVPLSVVGFINSSERIGHVNQLGANTFALLCAVGFFSWVLFESLGGNRVLMVIGAGICSVGLLGSRTVSVLAFCFALFPLVAWFRAKTSLPKLVLVVSCLFGLSGAVYWILENEVDFLRLEERNIDTLSGRSDVWANLPEVLQRHPFGATILDYEIESPFFHTYINLSGEVEPALLMPHNIIFDVAVFAGIPFGILSVIQVYCWLARISRIGMEKHGVPQIGAIPLIAVLSHMVMDMWYFHIFLAVVFLYIQRDWTPRRSP